ncbi:MAG: enolase C-terminal domain-like protein [Planctomycetales bacterium]
MRIVEIAAHHARIPLRRTIRHASHSRKRNDTLIVRCRLDDGTEGFGESLPRTYVTGETIDTVFETLPLIDWRKELGGDVGDLAAAIALLDQLRLPAPPDGARDCFGNAVRCAIELAVLDAVARRQGVPLSHVTGLLPETGPIRARPELVYYSGVVTSMGAAKEYLTAWAMRFVGFRQVKLKVGVDGVDDVAALRRVRRVMRRADLRIDANEAWAAGEVEAKIAPLAALGITSVEQPVPHAEVDRLAGIRGRIGVPVMLDESLCSFGDAERAAGQGTCDLFNIRLSKCGGFVDSLRLAAFAHRAGLGYQLGCQVGETGILSAAGRHFACSVAGIRHLEGSYDSFLVKERLTVEDLTFGWYGRAKPLTKPGLGVEIDRAALARVTRREERWSLER